MSSTTGAQYCKRIVISRFRPSYAKLEVAYDGAPSEPFTSFEKP
jgi:hypothetical protein